jgi:mono/diheme cytochrome c family protein
MRRMSWSGAATVTGLGLVLAGMTACSQSQQPAQANAPDEAAMEAAPSAARGEYLVKIGGCDDCHTPKVMTDHGPELDMQRRLSGHPAALEPAAIPADALTPGGWMAMTDATMTAWAGPWGISFTANLTPDATGLGNWTEDNFIGALRTGMHAGNGRPILPPMPWQGIGQLTDNDLKSVFAYLRTLPPVDNDVPQPVPPAGPKPGE